MSVDMAGRGEVSGEKTRSWSCRFDNSCRGIVVSLYLLADFRVLLQSQGPTSRMPSMDEDQDFVYLKSQHHITTSFLCLTSTCRSFHSNTSSFCLTPSTQPTQPPISSPTIKKGHRQPPKSAKNLSYKLPLLGFEPGKKVVSK